MSKIWFLLIAIFFLFTATNTQAERLPDENRTIVGYEINTDTIEIWNTQNSYYFLKNSGIQLTNDENAYWTKNIFCIGYYNADEWHKIKCANELPTFNKSINSDNETFVDANLWQDFEYSGYNMRLGINYHLETNDKNLSITIYAKNLGVDIPFDLGFAWKIQDWNIPSYETNDKIFIFNQSFDLNGTYNTTFTNLNKTFFEGYDYDFLGKKFLRIDWNENLNYKVKMIGDGNQENFYIALLINAGHFNPQQEKKTTFKWIDAVVMGTNSGFVTEAPVDDPGGIGTWKTSSSIYATHAGTSDATARKVTEIGWYRTDDYGDVADYGVAIYADDSGVPGNLIHSSIGHEGSDAEGWKVVTGLNFTISPNTLYWVSILIGADASGISVDFGASGGSGYDNKLSESFDNPYDGGELLNSDWLLAVYAVWEAEEEETPCDYTYNENWVINDECYFADTTINLGTGTLIIGEQGLLGLQSSTLITSNIDLNKTTSYGINMTADSNITITG